MLENIIVKEINEKLEDKWEDYFIYNSLLNIIIIKYGE